MLTCSAANSASGIWLLRIDADRLLNGASGHPSWVMSQNGVTKADTGARISVGTVLRQRG